MGAHLLFHCPAVVRVDDWPENGWGLRYQRFFPYCAYGLNDIIASAHGDAAHQGWLEEHVRGFLEQIRREVEPHTFRAFELYVWEQRPVEHVCQELGITANQVYKSKWRVTQKLAEKMKRIES